MATTRQTLGLSVGAARWSSTVPSAFPLFSRSLHPLLAILSPALLPPNQIGRGRDVGVGLGLVSARRAKPAHPTHGLQHQRGDPLQGGAVDWRDIVRGGQERLELLITTGRFPSSVCQLPKPMVRLAVRWR